MAEYNDIIKEEGSYVLEKAVTKKFWERELSRIGELPKGVRADEEKITLVRSFVAQILQCFCYYVGENTLVSRQGGLQRLTWSGEFIRVLETLAKAAEKYNDPLYEEIKKEAEDYRKNIQRLFDRHAKNILKMFYPFPFLLTAKMKFCLENTVLYEQELQSL